MKNIKLRAVAASLSALMVISSFSILSASAVETTSHNTGISETVTDPTYSTKLKVYNDTKAYLKELKFDAETISSVLKHPDDTNHQAVSTIKVFIAYAYAKDFLLNRGYDLNIIDSVLVCPL